jgi:hypothetical protein
MPSWPRLKATTSRTRHKLRQRQPCHIQRPCCPPPPPYNLRGHGPFYNGGEHSSNALALAPLAIPSPIVDGQLQMVRQRAQPHCCTGCCHQPCTPSPPDKVLPSHPHPTLGGLSTPTRTLTTLVRGTPPCCSVMLSPPTSSRTSSTPSLLPSIFSGKVLLSSGGGTAYPFCVGGQNSPPWKHLQRKHQPHCAGRRHGPRAPDP